MEEGDKNNRGWWGQKRVVAPSKGGGGTAEDGEANEGYWRWQMFSGDLLHASLVGSIAGMRGSNP
jgi:hypothetical protein